jgi:hypothetical protein
MTKFRLVHGGYAAASEQIDVVRVKLLVPGGSAVVSELRAADLVLAKWVSDGLGSHALDYEITFNDGFAFHGRYRQRKKAKVMPSFTRMVRQVFKELQELPNTLPPGTKFLRAPTADLTRYAIYHH